MKILIGMTDFYTGGTERALLNMLELVDFSNHQVTLMLVNNEGAMINQIPQTYNVDFFPLSEEHKRNLSRSVPDTIKQLIKQKKIIQATKIFLRRVFGDHLAVIDDFDKIENLNEKFDLAISYSAQMPFVSKFIATKVSASRKILWVHNSFLDSKYNYRNLLSYIDCYDKIISVSYDIENEVKNIFGSAVATKVETIHNFYPISEIINQSKESAPELSLDFFTIVTVARLVRQKGIDLAIKAARKLKDRNIKFKWYVVGEGIMRPKLEKMILKYGLEEEFILLGIKKNPYPYIKNACLYVQPSRHEGYCTTTIEAKILKKLIITTNVQGAKEQFTSNFDGLICDIDAMSIYEVISNCIINYDASRLLIDNINIDEINNRSLLKINLLLSNDI